ncbi:MAG: hypothetical protein KKB59_14195 [Spirochaetes bacterium]|nr:hypothetical protein [Spirochaetota bacterium]
MPGRKWTVEEHPQKQKIIKAIIAGKQSLRDIGRQYDITVSSVSRYLNDKLMEKAAAVILEQDKEAGKTLIDELIERDKRVEKLFDACERYLQDPTNPNEYDLFPRAWEINVQYRTQEEGEKKPTYHKEALQTILERMEDKGMSPVELKYRHADPRKLLLEAANCLKGTMELRAKLAGKLVEGGVTVNINQTFTAIKAIIVKATEGYPQVRAKMVEELAKMEGEDGL